MAAGKHQTTSLPESPEVRLNQKQLFLIFFGGLIVMAMVFALGVMTGLNWKAQVQKVPESELAALDEAARLKRTGGDPDAMNLKTDATQQEEAQPKKEKPKEANKAEAAKAAAPQKAEQKPAPEKKQEKPQGESKQPAAEEQTPSGLAQPEEAANPRFALQISAVKDEGSSEKEIKYLEKLGLKGYVRTKKIDDQNTLYRVRIGAFADRDTVDSFKEQFEKVTGRNTMVVNY